MWEWIAAAGLSLLVVLVIWLISRGPVCPRCKLARGERQRYETMTGRTVYRCVMCGSEFRHDDVMP